MIRGLNSSAVTILTGALLLIPQSVGANPPDEAKPKQEKKVDTAKKAEAEKPKAKKPEAKKPKAKKPEAKKAAKPATKKKAEAKEPAKPAAKKAMAKKGPAANANPLDEAAKKALIAIHNFNQKQLLAAQAIQKKSAEGPAADLASTLADSYQRLDKNVVGFAKGRTVTLQELEDDALAKRWDGMTGAKLHEDYVGWVRSSHEKTLKEVKAALANTSHPEAQKFFEGTSALVQQNIWKSRRRTKKAEPGG